MKITGNAIVLLGILISTQTLAEKPGPAGKGKAAEQRLETPSQGMHKQDRQVTSEMTREAKEQKEGMATRLNKEKKHKKDQAEEPEKAREQQTDKERKELGKGSEQGQAMREEHSRKWWKFWE